MTKQWLDLEDQVKLLKQRGMLIDDDQKAISYLERIGYYRLSGYSYPFREFSADSGRLDTFVEGTRLSDVIDLFVFDKKLRLLALDALERIELAVRVDIAYLLGQRDPLCHLNANHFMGIKDKKGKSIYMKWQATLQDKVRRARNEPYIAHHMKHYDGQLPIWVAIEVWDFGMLSTLYSLLKVSDQKIIAKKYHADEITGKHQTLFVQWLRSLNFIRNVSAHHARLWNISVKDRANLSTKIIDKNILDNSRPFYYFTLIKWMLDCICPNSTWKLRFMEHIGNFPKNLPKQVSVQQIGLIDEWGNLEVWSE